MNREVNEDLIQKLKARVRAMSKAAEDEIKDLVLSCRKELELVGIYGDESDPTYYQASCTVFAKGITDTMKTQTASELHSERCGTQ